MTENIRIRRLLAHMQGVIAERVKGMPQMKYLTFHVKCSFTCKDGFVFAWIFSESQWVAADAEGTWTENGFLYYTPQDVIDRVVETFFEGLTESEKEQARKTFKLTAVQARVPGFIPDVED
jgi:hypothetical protein